MGDAPKLLGGATFVLEYNGKATEPQEPSLLHHRSKTVPITILSAVVEELRQAGFRMTDAQRGKPDDVRCRCEFGDCRIELILVAEEAVECVRPFLLLAFDFSKILGPVAQSEANKRWDEIYAIANEVIHRQFIGTPFTRLTPAEADNHCNKTR